MDVELGFYTGVLLGLRTYEPNEEYQRYEFHIYIPFVYLAFIYYI